MANKILIFGLLLLFSSNTFSQNTDSLIYESVKQLQKEQLQTRNLSLDNNKNLYKLGKQLPEIQSLIIEQNKQAERNAGELKQKLDKTFKVNVKEINKNLKIFEAKQQRKFRNHTFLHIISWVIILFLIAALYITKINSLDYLLSKVDLQATQNDEILKKAGDLKKIKKELKKFNKQIKKKKKL